MMHPKYLPVRALWSAQFGERCLQVSYRTQPQGCLLLFQSFLHANLPPQRPPPELWRQSGRNALPQSAQIRNDFVRFGEARYGRIGAKVREAASAVEGSRAETTEIVKDTPAAESGMKPGDIVLQIGRTKVHEPEDILDASFYLTAGDVVPITVMRGQEKLTFNVEAASSGPPLLAAPSLNNRAMPLSLQSAPE